MEMSIFFFQATIQECVSTITIMGEEILSEKILRSSRFVRPIFEDKEQHAYHISWTDFVYLLEGVILKEKRVVFEEEKDTEDQSTASLQCQETTVPYRDAGL